MLLNDGEEEEEEEEEEEDSPLMWRTCSLEDYYGQENEK